MLVSCVLETASDKKTLCGEKRDDVPTTLARFVMAHKRGHNMIVCSDCLKRAITEGISLDDYA